MALGDKVRYRQAPAMPSLEGVIDSGALSTIDTVHAALPEAYEQARAALATCAKVDECKDWADRMAALASYAKQADDLTLFKFAVRIAARAVRRTGELLEMFRVPQGSRGPGRSANEGRGAPTLSRRDVAHAAGLSKDREVQAVRVARVPQAAFDAAVDSDDPPTVTALAARGTTPTTRQAPPGFKEATEFFGLLGELAEFCELHDASGVVRGVMDDEVNALLADVSDVKVWLSTFEGVVEKEARHERLQRRDAARRDQRGARSTARRPLGTTAKVGGPRGVQKSRRRTARGRR